MSDEEKKAIEWLKKADWFSARLYAPTILYLIEKQSKEIEELNKSDESKEQSSMKYYNLYRELVDKIKAKIEELDEEIKVKKEIARKPMDRVSGRLLTDSIVELEKTKIVLQSLLENE